MPNQIMPLIEEGVAVPLREKTVFYTKVDDQICGVGYYKE